MSEQEWVNIFGDNLEYLLEKYDMMASELAREMGVERSTISSYIHKRKMISVENLINLSDCFGISMNDLANFDEFIY